MLVTNSQPSKTGFKKTYSLPRKTHIYIIYLQEKKNTHHTILTKANKNVERLINNYLVLPLSILSFFFFCRFLCFLATVWKLISHVNQVFGKNLKMPHYHLRASYAQSLYKTSILPTMFCNLFFLVTVRRVIQTSNQM